jgi:iron complex outermembrane receptor protein
MSWPRVSLAFVAFLSLGPPVAHAQQAAVPTQELIRRGFFEDFNDIDIETLLKPDQGAVGLTTRSDVSLEEAPGVVSVVTAEDIRRLGARTLGDVLRTVPGFDILVDSLGRSSFVVRGVPRATQNGSSEKILVLFNGLPLNEGIEGGATLSNLEIPVGGLKKIEILRGPGSALFGAGAQMGVVNLISSTPEDFTGTAASVGFGSFGSETYDLRLGNVFGDVNLSGFVRFDRVGGANLAVPEDTQTFRDPAQVAAHQAAASLAPGTTTDGIKAVDTEYHLTYRNLEINARIVGQSDDGYVGLADALGTQNNLSGRQYGLDVGYTRIFGPYVLQARVDYTRSQNEQHLQVYPPNFILFSSGSSEPPAGVQFGSGVFLVTTLASQRFAADGTLQRTIGSHHLEGGVSLARESTFGLGASSNLDFATGTAFDSITALPGAFVSYARTSTGLWLEDQWKATSRLSITGGARWDHLNDVGDEVSPRLAAVYTVPQGPSFKALYGRSYRAPSFEELAFDLPGLIGVPTLRPEVADTVEGAFVWKRSDLVLSADYFFTSLRDLIATAGPFDPQVAQPFVNGPGVHTNGFEVEARRILSSSSSLFLAYTHESTTDRATGLDVPDAAANLAFLGGTFAVRDWGQVTPTLLVRDSRPRAGLDPRPAVPAYALLDLNLRSKQLYKTFTLTVTGRNLLNKSYFDPAPINGLPGDYPRPGRSFLVIASYTF